MRILSAKNKIILLTQDNTLKSPLILVQADNIFKGCQEVKDENSLGFGEWLRKKKEFPRIK